MGSPKQLLEVQGKTMVDHAISAATSAGINQPILVLGSCFEDIMEKSKHSLDCKIIFNPDYQAGQASSLIKGVAAIPENCDAALFLLCDQPLVKGKLLESMMAYFTEKKPDILYPTYKKHRGNPVIISKTLFPKLLTARGDKGARFLFSDKSLNVLTFTADDIAVVTDIDTPQDYQSICEKSY